MGTYGENHEHLTMQKYLGLRLGLYLRKYKPDIIFSGSAKFRNSVSPFFVKTIGRISFSVVIVSAEFIVF